MKKVKQYALGGIFGKASNSSFFGKGFNLTRDILLEGTDGGLSALGLNNVIQKKDYSNGVFKKLDSVNAKVAPVVGQALATYFAGPAGGAAVKGLQSYVGGAYNPDPQKAAYEQAQRDAQAKALSDSTKGYGDPLANNLDMGMYAKGGKLGTPPTRQDTTAPQNIVRGGGSTAQDAPENLAIKLARKALPINVAMYGQSLVRDKTPLTERDLNPTELNVLRSTVRTAKSQGTPDIDYNQYPENFSAARGREGVAALTRNPSTRMSTTIGKARLEDKAGSTTLKDTYDFNVREPFSMEALLNKSSLYGGLRYLGGQFASKEGIPVNINLGNVKRPGRNEKFALGGELNPEYEVEQGEVVQGSPQLEESTELASDLHHVGGNKHENGGTQGAGGERVFSDQIKVGKDTIADLAKRLGRQKAKLEAKLDTHSEFGRNTAQRMLPRVEENLDNLFAYQEMSKPPTATTKFANGGYLRRSKAVGQLVPNTPSQLTPNYDTLAPSMYLRSNAQGSDPVNPMQSRVGAALSDVDWKGVGSKVGEFGQTVAPYIDNIANSFITPPKPLAPVLTAAPKLNTTVDINPELNQLGQQARNFNQAIDRSTASSSTARSNKVSGYVNQLGEVGKLYGAKRREEQGLQNQQALLDYQTSAQNNGLRNNYQQQLTATEAERRAGISANISNAALDVQGQIRDKNFKEADINKIGILAKMYNTNGVVDRKLLLQTAMALGISPQELTAKIKGEK